MRASPEAIFMRIVAVVLVVALVSSGCGDDRKKLTDATGGSTSSSGGRASGAGGETPTMARNGGAPASNVAGAAMSSGGNIPSLAGGGAANASGGATGAVGSGGANGSAGSDAGKSSYGELSVFGNTTTLELTPVLLAKDLYPGTATVKNGGIADLWSGGDLATNAETQSLLQSVSHPNLRIVFTVCEGFYRIVARRSAGIATLADLRGKRIATIPGTSSAYFLHSMLGTVQLGDADVTVVASGAPSAIPDLLSRRTVDAVTIWEPEIQKASDALGSDAIEFQEKSVYRELFSLHTTAEKLENADARRSIVEFLRRLIAASTNITLQPSSAWPLAANTTGYDSALIAKAWVNEGFPGTLVPDLLDVLEQEESWLAKNAGRKARSRAELATLVDDGPFEEALASP